MDLMLPLVVFLGVWVAPVFGLPQLTIQPSTVLSGDSVQFTCSDTEKVGFLSLYKVTTTTTQKDVASLSFFTTPPVLTIQDNDVKARVPEDHMSFLGSSFSLNYTRAKCDDGYSYVCESVNQTNSKVKSTYKPLTVIDTNAPIGVTVQGGDCATGIDQGECDDCDPGQDTNTDSVGKVGKEIAFSCTKKVPHPETKNTFSWYIQKHGVWTKRTEDIDDPQPSTDAPRPTDSQGDEEFCYNSTMPHTSTMQYTPTAEDPTMVKVKCEVVYNSDGVDDSRDSEISMCIIDGKVATTPSPPASTTTPKTNEDTDSGFSLTSGPGIAVITALVVLLVAGIGGASYWWWRRHTAAPANNADYYDGDENYT